MVRRFLGLFLVFVELPACCSCVPACARVVTFLKVCNTYWLVRGVSYMVLAAVGIVRAGGRGAAGPQRGPTVCVRASADHLGL